MDTTHTCGNGCGTSRIFKGLLVIGGLNWGLVGVGSFFAANWNIVNLALGGMPALEAIVYILVGVAAIGSLFGCRCKKCKEVCASCQVKSAPAMPQGDSAQM